MKQKQISHTRFAIASFCLFGSIASLCNLLYGTFLIDDVFLVSVNFSISLLSAFMFYTMSKVIYEGD